MTLLDARNILAAVLSLEDIYAGNIDGNMPCCVGVYPSRNAGERRICIGGKSCTKTQYKKLSLLVHWTDNPTGAEKKAQQICEAAENVRELCYDGFTVHFIQAREPISLGRDEHGICEYTIETTIIYEEV